MLVHTDPFRDLDSLVDRLSGPSRTGTRAVPMDAYRRGEDVWVHLDMPGVAADSLDISVERNVLTIVGQRRTHRQDRDRPYVTERPTGTFRRQLHLGQGLDVDAVEADYHDGVLTLRIPVAERAKPRRIRVNGAGGLAAAGAAEGAAADAPAAIDAASAVSQA